MGTVGATGTVGPQGPAMLLGARCLTRIPLSASASAVARVRCGLLALPAIHPKSPKQELSRGWGGSPRALE